MNRDDAEEYTQSLGQIVAGSWRQIAWAVRMGVPAALGLSTRAWVERLGGYVKLPVSERVEAVKELTAEGMTQRKVGEVLGISQSKVSVDLKRSSQPKNTDGSKDVSAVLDRKKSDKTKLPKKEDRKAAPPAATPADPIQTPCVDCETPEQDWQHSLSNLAGDAIASRAYWSRQFPSWETFEAPSELVTLAKQASKAWADLASDLVQRKEKQDGRNTEEAQG